MFVSLCSKYIIFLGTFVGFCSVLHVLVNVPRNNLQEMEELYSWLTDNGYEDVKFELKAEGINTPVKFASLEGWNKSRSITNESVNKAANIFKQKLVLKQWMELFDIQSYYEILVHEGIVSIEDIYWVSDDQARNIFGKDISKWSSARQELPSSKEDLSELKVNLWNLIISTDETWKLLENVWFYGSIIVVSLSAAGIVTLFVCSPQSSFAMKAQTSLLNIMTGRYLDPKNCQVYFNWKDPHQVGDTMTFIIKFFQRNGLPYPICDQDHVQININVGVRTVLPAVSFGSTELTDANVAAVKFTARIAGQYRIDIFVKDIQIYGSPYLRTFYPGNIDPKKTEFENLGLLSVCFKDRPYFIQIDPKDCYYNSCLGTNGITNNDFEETINNFHTVVTRSGEVTSSLCFQSFIWYKTSSKISFDVIFLEEGCFHIQVYYDDLLLDNGSFTCIVLNDDDKEILSNSLKNHTVYYEGKLIRIEGEPMVKPRKVLIFLSPKQFTIKEHVLKFIPRRVATFRVCPSTKLQLLDETANGVPSFMVDDGSQPQVYIASLSRNIIAATYAQFLLGIIGGSQTFKEKQHFFYYKVRKFHSKHRHHDNISLKINRNDLLMSSLKATKWFTVKEWCRNFEIIFENESGIDYGGLRREWIQLICNFLFHPDNDLFKPFVNSAQALIHPNRKRRPDMKLKYFEFAGRILGKCLYESALGGSYSQYIRVKFTRSFLAQLLGLRINHRYFKSDDPDFYLGKVRYILENDVTNMDLFFIEEEFTENGQISQVIDLIPNGSKIKVTNRTKIQYLDNVAQYRLSTCVKEEVDSFLKGLNELIPDNLLCIFDENELELLLCGTEEYDIADLKTYHVVYPTPEFSRVLNWFWSAVSNFTKDEIAQLLQFTTGSSQLPPGGFKDLSPQFTIVPAVKFGVLPTAHTCFNTICLPDYESYEQFEKSLLLAISEGSEGFFLV